MCLGLVTLDAIVTARADAAEHPSHDARIATVPENRAYGA